MITTRFLRQAAFCSLMTLLVSSVLQAQPPGGGGQPPQEGGRQRGGGRGFGGGGFGGPGGGFGGFRVDRAMLLGNDKVRAELKIEEAQAATIDAALEAFREEQQSSFPRPDRNAPRPEVSDEERTAAREKARKDREELSKKTDEVLNALMEPEQTKRLDEISFQVRINMATLSTLKADDIKAKLTITDEQVAKLTEAEEAAAAEMQKTFEEMRAAGGGGGGGGGFEGMREKMEAVRKKTTEAAMALLTDVQKTSIEEMKGAAFELDMMSLMGGRGGPGGGRGGPGGGGGRPGGGGRGTRPPTE